MNRDAATQVSEVQLLQEFGSVTSTRDVSTQVSEDELRNDEHSPVDEDQEPVDPFVPSAPEQLPDAASGVYGDELQLLPLDGSTDFIEDATVGFQTATDQDFVDLLDDFNKGWQFGSPTRTLSHGFIFFFFFFETKSWVHSD